MPQTRTPFAWHEPDAPVGIGLISGTSLDGIDAAVVRFPDGGLPEVLHFATMPYPPALHELLVRLAHAEQAAVDDLLRAHWAAGHAFARAAQQVQAASKVAVHFAGSHGQTIRHRPQASPIAGLPAAGSLQIGEAAVIAEALKVPVVADFRSADIAAGGEGAPLVPYFDVRFFASPDEHRVLLNIGGIANFTYLPAGAGLNEVVARDTGPGNMLIDALAQHFFGQPFDPDGRLAAQGQVHAGLLRQLCDHPYFARTRGQSTGREEFGAAFAGQVVALARDLSLSPEDALATATAFSATTIDAGIRRAGAAVNRVLVSGGGRHNRTLLASLQRELAPAVVQPFDETGISSEAKEAVCFAFLALLALRGEPGNVPQVTGARRRVVLGKICWPL